VSDVVYVVIDIEVDGFWLGLNLMCFFVFVVVMVLGEVCGEFWVVFELLLGV